MSLALAAALAGCPADRAPRLEPSPGEPPDPVAALVDRLLSGDAESQVEAARALEALGPAAAEPAFGPLVAALRSREARSAMAAGDALRRLGVVPDGPPVLAPWITDPYAPAADDLLAPLLADLACADPARRTAAALVVGAQEVHGAATALVARLRTDGSGAVRAAAASSLGLLAGSDDAPGPPDGPPEAEATSALVAALRDEDAGVRLAAAWALDAFGAVRAAEAAAALSERVREDGVAVVREAAALALGRGRSAEAVPALLAALRDPHADTRRAGVTGLGRRPDEPTALTGAAALLGDRTAAPDARLAAAEALGWLGPASVPALRAALEDDDEGVRVAAARALVSDLDRRRRRIDEEDVVVAGDALADTLPSWVRRSGEGEARVNVYVLLDAIPPSCPRREEVCHRLLAASLQLEHDDRPGAPRSAMLWPGEAMFFAIVGALGPDAPRAWRVLPRVYARELLASGLLLWLWFGLAARKLRARRSTAARRALAGALVTLPAAAAAAGLVWTTLARPWVAPLLPTDLPLLVPLPLAATLSTALVCALAGVWASVPRGEPAAEAEAPRP